MANGSGKNKKAPFELWRDRLFSVLVPVFLGYILFSQVNTTNTIKIVIIVLLLGFATGEAALIGRHLLALLGRLTGIDHNQEDKPRKEDKQSNNNKYE